MAWWDEISGINAISTNPILRSSEFARILIPLYLVSQNLLSKPLLYMSAFFEANKNSYYQKLMQVRMNNKLLDWLLFFLKGVEIY
jgi:Fic family protein